MLRATLAALVATFLLAAPAAAQRPLFESNSELEITLEAPFTALLRNARRGTEAVPATLVLDGGGERYNLLLSPRGMSRRIGGFCTFPPLLVDFENNELRETLFRGQNRLKLTTHCRPTESYEQLYMLEYVAYRLYNEISPYSFRARPLRVTYRDTDGRRRDETRFGFFLEDEDDVARRNQRVALDIQTRAVSVSQLDAAAAARAALFQYMIGNLDWDMLESAADRKCCHNIRLLAPSDANRTGIIPAPYDFDHSGFVNAPYARPPEAVSVRNVRQRLYRGNCAHNDQLPAAIALFQSRREALNAVIANETRLSDSRRESARTYIDGFFDVVGDPRAVQRQLIERCRNQSTG